MSTDKRIRPEDLSDMGAPDYSEIPTDVREMEPLEQAEWAANSLARALEDLPEVSKVLERKKAPGRIWVRIRVQPENEESWSNGPAFRMADLFQDKNNVEFCVAREVVRVQTPLGQKKPVYGWFIAVATQDLPGFIRDVSDVLYDPDEKLLVAASPLMGAGTPQGSLVPKGGKGTRGAIIVNPNEHGA